MAGLTIGGQERELRLAAVDVVKAEERMLKAGGRPLLAAVAAKNGDTFFAGFELEALCWGAWRHTLSEERIRLLLAQFYAEGGTLFDLHREVVEALIESGVFGRRAADAVATNGDHPDPPRAGRSV